MTTVPDLLAPLGDQIAGASDVVGERGRAFPRIADRGAQFGHGVGLVGNVRVPVEDAQSVRRLQHADDVIAVGCDAGEFFLIVPGDAVVREGATHSGTVAEVGDEIPHAGAVVESPR